MTSSTQEQHFPFFSLPVELQRNVCKFVYDKPWSLYIRSAPYNPFSPTPYREDVVITGAPSLDLLLVCQALRPHADWARQCSFNGTIEARDAEDLERTLERSTPFAWLRQRITTIILKAEYGTHPWHLKVAKYPKLKTLEVVSTEIATHWHCPAFGHGFLTGEDDEGLTESLWKIGWFADALPPMYHQGNPPIKDECLQELYDANVALTLKIALFNRVEIPRRFEGKINKNRVVGFLIVDYRKGSSEVLGRALWNSRTFGFWEKGMEEALKVTIEEEWELMKRKKSLPESFQWMSYDLVDWYWWNGWC